MFLPLTVNLCGLKNILGEHILGTGAKMSLSLLIYMRSAPTEHIESEHEKS